jgi:hypothetical protein
MDKMAARNEAWRELLAGQVQSALPKLAGFAAANPTYHPAQRNYACALMAAGDYARARSIFVSVLAAEAQVGDISTSDECDIATCDWCTGSAGEALERLRHVKALHFAKRTPKAATVYSSDGLGFEDVGLLWLLAALCKEDAIKEEAKIALAEKLKTGRGAASLRAVPEYVVGAMPLNAAIAQLGFPDLSAFLRAAENGAYERRVLATVGPILAVAIRERNHDEREFSMLLRKVVDTMQPAVCGWHIARYELSNRVSSVPSL